MRPISKDITKHYQMACRSMSYTPFAFCGLMFSMCLFSLFLDLWVKNNEQVFPNWKHLLLIDYLSEDIQIFLIVSDRRYTSYHSHHIKMFGNSEQVQYWCQVNEYCY